MADLHDLIRQLGEPDKAAHAFQALRDRGSAAVEPLLAALGSPDANVRRQAATLLAAAGDTRAVSPLMELTTDASQQVRNTAVAGLGAFAADPRVAHFLRQVALGSGDPDFRMRAVFASGPPNTPAVQALWLELLNDPAEQIVVNAASKLGDSGRADVVEPLIAALHRVGENHPAFAFILRALGKLGDKRAFEPIAAYLKSPNAYRRASAAHALGQLGDLRAVERLEPLTKDGAFAWEEDHGGPKSSVGDVARAAIAAVRKASGIKDKPRWKFW